MIDPAAYTWPPSSKRRRTLKEVDPAEISLIYREENGLVFGMPFWHRQCRYCHKHASCGCVGIAPRMCSELCRACAQWIEGQPYCRTHVPTGGSE